MNTLVLFQQLYYTSIFFLKKLAITLFVNAGYSHFRILLHHFFLKPRNGEVKYATEKY